DEAANQINYLESLYQTNPADSRIGHYASLRSGGQSVQDIITHEIPQDKTSLVGNDDNAGATDAGRLNVTYHHNAFTLVRQRTQPPPPVSPCANPARQHPLCGVTPPPAPPGHEAGATPPVHPPRAVEDRGPPGGAAAPHVPGGGAAPAAGPPGAGNRPPPPLRP